MTDENDDANLANAANEPPADHAPGTGLPDDTNANDIPANPPGPMANFDTSQTVDGNTNENPANLGVNTNTQMNDSTDKTSMDETTVNGTSRAPTDNSPEVPTMPSTGNPDATQNGEGA